MVSHLLLILDDLKKFVDAVEDKTVNVTKRKSNENMLKALKNIKLLRSRLEFFVSVARELEPFMRQYQTNNPLAPLMYNELQRIMCKLLRRFIKADLVNDLKSGSAIMKFDIKKELNLLPLKEVDIGFGARRALSLIITKAMKQ